MAAAIREIILNYIDEALDVDDLENIGDYVRSVVNMEDVADWQMNQTLRQLHEELCAQFSIEPDRTRKMKLKSAISYFEADFTDYLIDSEIETLSQRDNFN